MRASVEPKESGGGVQCDCCTATRYAILFPMANSATLQRLGSLPESRAFWRRWELPTWGVAIAIYASWATLLMLHEY